MVVKSFGKRTKWVECTIVPRDIIIVLAGGGLRSFSSMRNWENEME